MADPILPKGPDFPRAISFDRTSLGQRQPWEIVWRRLPHAGEVIVADAVLERDFEPLTGDTSFRIILATRGLKPRARPEDARTVLAVPRFRFDPIVEIQRASGSAATAEAIDSRDSQLRHLVQMEQTSEWRAARRRIARAYAEGRIYGHETASLSAAEVFDGDTPEQCTDEIASRLLSTAFPDLPIDSTTFPGTLGPDSIRALYEGLFQNNRSVEAVQGFGPGLGVVTGADGGFDGSNSAVHDIIEDHLARRGGAMPSAELIEVLVHGHGLTRHLAIFYLLSFVMHVHAEVELTDDHNVRTPDGERFPGDRLTWDMLSEVEFSSPLFEALVTLRSEPSPTWTTMVPYVAALTSGLDAPDAAPVETERDLMRRASELGDAVTETRAALARLAEAFPRADEIASDVLRSLGGLSRAADHTEFFDLARERFGSPTGFAEALEAFRRTRLLAEMVDEITQIKVYLESMTFGRLHGDLALKRDSVAARIDPGNLHANPTLWRALEVSVGRVRERYASTYRAHHLEYHRAALSLRSELGAREARVNALSRFNEISDLGEPVGAGVQSAYRDLPALLRHCGADDEPALDSMPRCQFCHLPLAEDVPKRVADELYDEMDTAMREYNRRLSSQAVRQVLANQSKEQLDKFIGLLQVADPSALEYALDDVIEFLRQFMR